jgi:biopolymer transport protein ExbB
MFRWRWVAAAALMAGVLTASWAFGGGPTGGGGADPPRSEAAPRLTFLRLISYSGPVGYGIIALSFAAVALSIDYARTIRREKLMPPQMVIELQDLINRNQFKEALLRCEQDDSFLSAVVGTGLSVVSGGSTDAEEIQTAMIEAGEEQTARLYRRIEYLSLINAIAPMLGFLGTVTGMILAFNEVALRAERVRPADLAHGISQALVTTVMGLIVAIPGMGAFVMFRNRIDALAGEAETVVAQVTSRLRRLGPTKAKA